MKSNDEEEEYVKGKVLGGRWMNGLINYKGVRVQAMVSISSFKDKKVILGYVV